MKAELVDRVSADPTRKVVSGLTIGTPVSIVVVWLLTKYGGLDMPEAVQLSLQAIIQGVITFAVQYGVRDRAT